jgi:hypothetical protein
MESNRLNSYERADKVIISFQFFFTIISNASGKIILKYIDTNLNNPPAFIRN